MLLVTLVNPPRGNLLANQLGPLQTMRAKIVDPYPVMLSRSLLQTLHVPVFQPVLSSSVS